MDEEPTLPPLPAVSWNSQTDTLNRTSKKRARQHDGAPQFTNSSDPAVFSSDDDHPALENYTVGRKKKRFVGPWYHQQPASSDDSAFGEESQPLPKPDATKRTFARHLDSGVWMGSDATDGEDSIVDLPLPARSKLPLLVPAQRAMSSAEQHAQDVIQECAETGHEAIDLHGCEIETLSAATLNPLREFTCVPLVEKGVPFEQKVPSIKLFLANNLLRQIPPAIFGIEHLTVLSLRGNHLTKLPPAISKLRNLVTLNVSFNDLNHLPHEIFDLMKLKLRTLLIHPNPFVQPGGYEPHEDADADAGHVIALDGLKAIERARTPVQYLDSTGRNHSSSQTIGAEEAGGPRTLETEPLDAQPAPPATLKAATSSRATGAGGRVPSLHELCLRSYRDNMDRFSADFLDRAPHGIAALFARPRAQRASGGDGGPASASCAVCARAFVLPKTKWMTWWELSDGARADQLVPFLSEGCSWACVPPARRADPSELADGAEVAGAAA